MAKLNVVIPAVEVTVDGVTYRKVDRKAQAGDIVKALVNWTDVYTGDYYEVKDRNGETAFLDDNNEWRPVLLNGHPQDFEVYAPISEPATQPSTDTITFEGAAWRKVNRDAREGDAIKFTDEDRSSWRKGAELYVVYELDGVGDPQIKDDDGDEYDAGSGEFEVYEKVAEEKAVEYREVKRVADVGERIKIADKLIWERRYQNGDTFVVKESGHGGPVVIETSNDTRVVVLYPEYVVLEPVTAKKAEPERLAVGDYARYVKDGNNAMVTGDIVEITEVDQSMVPYHVMRLTDGYVAWAPANKLVRATDEEVASVKDPRSQFAAGDKVRLVSGGGTPGVWNYVNGEVYTVNVPIWGREDKIEIAGGGQPTAYVTARQIVKLTAAEIAEIERKQAEETKWNAIGRKVNELRDGDIVRFTENTCAVGYGIGKITEIRNVHGQEFNFGEAFRGRARWCELVTPVEQRFDRVKEVSAA